MNILYVTNHLNIGGVTRYVLTLSCGLKKKGHNVYIASSGGGLLPYFLKEGITYIPIPIKTKKEISPKILISMVKLSNYIRENKIDIVHSHSRTTQVLGCLLEKSTGIRHIFTCHGFFKRRFLRRLFPCWGRKIIAISEPVKEHLIRDFKVDEEKIAVIHNGIDVDKLKIPACPAGRQDLKFKIEAKKILGLTEGPVIGIISRLSDVKGHKYLIEAMKVVLEEVPQAQLLIVGEGKEKANLLKLVNDLGIAKNVFFKPEVQDTKDMLSAMDIFVLPSLKEGLGLALMEAMAGGLAVIGSDVGGIRSLIKDGVNGLLVKPADVSDLTRAILSLLENPDKAESLGRAARSFIYENFSQEKMVLETEKVYLECLSENQS
jgi:glycosyltransferase involved in cell wall biosynthesis